MMFPWFLGYEENWYRWLSDIIGRITGCADDEDEKYQNNSEWVTTRE